jgi:AraC-like DNA-binding protein
MNKSLLYFWYGQALFLGQSTDAADHRHHALQVGIGLNQPFSLTIDDAALECRVAVIAPDKAHRLVGLGDWQAIILLDPETEAARELSAKYLADKEFAIIEQGPPAEVMDRLRAFTTQPGDCPQARQLCGLLLGALIDQKPPLREYHEKIQFLIEYLNELPLKKISLQEIADQVFLSQSRIVHLFKEQVGIPIRRYLLWLRLMQAVAMVFKGQSFTNAAHEAGFADSAHLSRTFRDMFGVTLSDLFKNSQFVQAVSCRRPYSEAR